MLAQRPVRLVVVDADLTAETIEQYEQRIEEIEAERKRRTTIERFERRIEEIEAQIQPHLDELRALKAGLSRLQQGAESDPVGESGTSNLRPHATKARPSTPKTASARRRR